MLRRELICGRAAQTERREHEVRPLRVSSPRGNRVCEKHIVRLLALKIRGDTVSHTASKLVVRVPRCTLVGVQICSKNTQSKVTLPVPKSDTCEAARLQTA